MNQPRPDLREGEEGGKSEVKKKRGKESTDKTTPFYSPCAFFFFLIIPYEHASLSTQVFPLIKVESTVGGPIRVL